MKPKKKKSKDDLKFENEFLRAKIQMETGSAFHSSGKSASPELENIFLKNVDMFEREWSKAKQITVYEKIGKPKFRKLNEIPENELKQELDFIYDKLGAKGIAIDCIHKVEDREIYRFITEELFEHGIDDMSLPGWVTHYTYEEFYPNHEFDVKDHTLDFVKELLGDGNVESHLLCSKIKTSEGKIISSKNVLDKINLHRSFYSKFNLEDFKILSLQINKGKTSAKASFQVKYSATPDNSHEKQIFSGTGNAVLKNEYGCNWWTISEFKMPGFII